MSAQYLWKSLLLFNIATLGVGMGTYASWTFPVLKRHLLYAAFNCKTCTNIILSTSYNMDENCKLSKQEITHYHFDLLPQHCKTCIWYQQCTSQPVRFTNNYIFLYDILIVKLPGPCSTDKIMLKVLNKASSILTFANSLIE